MIKPHLKRDKIGCKLLTRWSYFEYIKIFHSSHDGQPIGKHSHQLIVLALFLTLKEISIGVVDNCIDFNVIRVRDLIYWSRLVRSLRLGLWLVSGRIAMYLVRSVHGMSMNVASGTERTLFLVIFGIDLLPEYQIWSLWSHQERICSSHPWLRKSFHQVNMQGYFVNRVVVAFLLELS